MFSLLNTLQLIIFEIDDMIFGRRKVKYSPAQRMLMLPFIGGSLIGLFFIIISFFFTIHQTYALEMCYRLLGVVICLNIIVYFPHIVMIRNIFGKIGYIIFCGVISAVFTVLFFAVMVLVLFFAILLLGMRILLFSASEKLPQPACVYSGGGGGGGGGGSFVRKDQDSYTLDNGDHVEYSPMTGNYVSTNPLFPTEYEKNNDNFTALN